MKPIRIHQGLVSCRTLFEDGRTSEETVAFQVDLNPEHKSLLKAVEKAARNGTGKSTLGPLVVTLVVRATRTLPR